VGKSESKVKLSDGEQGGKKRVGEGGREGEKR
jgi:hypothetical protein